MVTRRLFLRLLGAVYFIAFASLAAQIAGLAGERGITPRFVRAVLYDYRFSTARSAAGPGPGGCVSSRGSIPLGMSP